MKPDYLMDCLYPHAPAWVLRLDLKCLAYVPTAKIDQDERAFCVVASGSIILQWDVYMAFLD